MELHLPDRKFAPGSCEAIYNNCTLLLLTQAPGGGDSKGLMEVMSSCI